MILFNTDLDNTLIYSYKNDIGNDKKNVEIYQGREISFISDTAFELLKALKEKVLIIPTTTRTEEQYKRINLGVGEFRYALVCNGGVLLVDGEKDKTWYNESIESVKESREDIRKAFDFLEKDKRRYFELRYIENLFLFTKCIHPEAVINDLQKVISLKSADIFNNNDKVYVVPKALSKGNAVKRIKKRIHADYVIAAGDSEFDISMVSEADKGIVPKGFKAAYQINADIEEMTGEKLFSDELLSVCLKTAENIKYSE